MIEGGMSQAHARDSSGSTGRR